MENSNIETVTEAGQELNTIAATNCKENEMFIVVYSDKGDEMLSFRKSFVDAKKVIPSEIISLHPGVYIVMIYINGKGYSERMLVE
ncbi:MAG: hypothetical protein DWQ44_06455 [Bacteroidetes bacterium]|nr:MAG: hypothetical protein DWQ33_02925 [Bacteroidota bacterium]REK00938.1 MAG: hypothetical protein DWQ39_10220 [Bacteroidota bacterium]REK34541.1 MAG: hypothetical protein DWQ44_06455 [Bacteroidota bacterium]REK51799.1 MAG: hypothetical protein DWQ48_00050 [Bacteroidota bacterium]